MTEHCDECGMVLESAHIGTKLYFSCEGCGKTRSRRVQEEDKAEPDNLAERFHHWGVPVY